VNLRRLRGFYADIKAKGSAKDNPNCVKDGTGIADNGGYELIMS
jgi:hypothetical protein